jgi:small GTP-binding protein
MAAPDACPSAKIVFLGATSVGKTTIVTRITSGEFDPSIKPTIGACYASQTFTVGGNKIKLQIWDTAGQERFKTLVPMYYRGAIAAVICYSLVDSSSVKEVEFWINSVKAGHSSDPKLFIVGNKLDLEDGRQVPRAEGEKLAAKNSAEFFEISAQTGVGVGELFDRIAEVTYKIVGNEVSDPKSKGLNVATRSKKKGCC